MDKLISIFYTGIKNNDCYIEKHNFSKEKFFRFKYLCWFILLLILSPRDDISSKEIYLLYGKLHEKIFSDVNENKKVYLGLSLKKFNEIRKKRSIISHLSFLERVAVYYKSITSAKNNNIPHKKLHYWMDYYLIQNFIYTFNPKQVIVAGHFDKYTTWISYICYENKRIEMNISQHGAVESIELPYKIYCDKFFIFNSSEEMFIKKYIVMNSNCNFIVKGFTSFLKFKKYKKSNRKVIAIGSQDLYTDKTIKVTKYLLEAFEKSIEILIYVHYREDTKKLINEFKNNENVKIFTNERHDNIDILITYFSTIVYDYLSLENDIKIVCIPPDNIDISFFYNDKVTLVLRKEELREII